jgi:YD repeat-containing protein
MRTITILAILFALASCGGRGQNKAGATATEPQGEYYEWVTKYTNSYNADSRLVKVVERDYPVIGGLELPFDKTRTYEYEYRKLSDGATEQRKYYIWDNGERELEVTLITSPLRWEEIKDSVNYERKRFDAAGRLVMEERRYKSNASDFDMVLDTYDKEEYEYDALGREVKRTWLRWGFSYPETDPDVGEVVTAYENDTDRMVSETFLPENTLYPYRYEFSGDTLVMKQYRADTLMSVRKTISGDTVYISYMDGVVDEVGEIITDGERRIEVAKGWYDYGGHLDSTYYQNDLITRMFGDTPPIRRIHSYEYDKHGNPTSERIQIWSREEETTKNGR